MEEELRLQHDKLEALVEERANELLAANEELTAMNEEITAINAMLEDSNRRLESEIAERKKKEAELVLRERQYRAASNLVTSLISATDEQLKDVVSEALLLVKAPAGYIALYDQASHTIDICHAIGPKEIFVMGPRSADQGMLGEVFHNGQILFVEDYRQYAHRLPDQHLSRLTSILMIPFTTVRVRV